MMMTKKELILIVHESFDGRITKKDAAMVVDSVLEAAKTALLRAGELKLSGFGSFVVKKRPARIARNPQTGESIEVPAKLTVKFKASKILNELMKDLKDVEFEASEDLDELINKDT